MIYLLLGVACSVVAAMALPLLLPQPKPPPDADQSPGPSKLAIKSYLLGSYLLGPSSYAELSWFSSSYSWLVSTCPGVAPLGMKALLGMNRNYAQIQILVKLFQVVQRFPISFFNFLAVI